MLWGFCPTKSVPYVYTCDLDNPRWCLTVNPASFQLLGHCQPLKSAAVPFPRTLQFSSATSGLTLLPSKD
jgi:hypothetical protein